MGFCTPIVLARLRFYGVFLFSFVFFRPSFSSCCSVSELFSESNHIRQSDFLLSHGLPRSSGRLAQIRVSGFSLLYHRYISSQLRQDAITRSRSHTVRPTSWSGHRPCPKFTCPCPWCACLPLSDRCPGPLRVAQWTGRVRTFHVWYLVNLRDLWSLVVLDQRGVRRLECRATLSLQPRHGW